MVVPQKLSIGQRLRLAREANGWTQQELADIIDAPVLNINRWEKDKIRPGPHYKKKLSDAFNKSIDELFRSSSEEAFLPIWNVPHLRNLYFTGRKEMLTLLHNALAIKKTIALTQPLAISGLGGIGKTQIALEYIYRYGDEYKTVLWVRADSHELLISEFASLATLLNLPVKKQPGQKVTAVQRWLQHNSQWLLVVDNADDIELVSKVLPTRGTGHILITTRSQPTGKNIKGIEVEKMEREDGILFVLRRAKFIAEDATTDSASDAEKAAAETIYDLLDGLPLALDQVASYVEETRRSLQDYLFLYGKRHEILLRRRGSFSQDYPNSVATTWSISFERLKQSNFVAAEFLHLLAFLHPDAIPEEMIVDAAAELGPILQVLGDDPIQLDETIGALLMYSLVNRNPDTKTLSIHRLVQVVIKDGMDKEIQQQWAERTVRAVNHIYPSVEQATWVQCEKYLSHAHVCASLIGQWNMTFIEAARLLYEIGVYFFDHAQYTQAELLFLDALSIYEHNFGSISAEVAITLDKLANSYQLQGKYGEALRRRKQVLKIRRATLKPDDVHISSALNNLATVYHDNGNLTQAEKYYRQAIAISECAINAITSKEPYVIIQLSNLSNLYRTQGSYTEGVKCANRALDICTTTIGMDHPQFADCINSLAALYEKLGNLLEAEKLYKQALEIRQRLLFPTHPDVAISLNNLAVVYYQLGRFSQAEPLLEQALEIDEQVFGPTHPIKFSRLNNLGAVLFAQKKYEQAEVNYFKALSIMEKAHGKNYPDLVHPLNNLADLYLEQCLPLKANPVLKRALSIAERKLAQNSLSLATIYQHYGRFYTAQGQYEDAAVMHTRSLEIRQSVLGDSHYIVAKSFYYMALMYAEQENNDEAEKLLIRTIAMCEEGLGSNHSTLALYVESYAVFLQKVRREVEAQVQADRARMIRENIHKGSSVD